MHGPRSLLGIETVRLSVGPPSGSVGPVDVKHLNAVLKEKPRQGSPEEAGPFDADGPDLSEALQPSQELDMSLSVGRELPCGQQLPGVGKGRCVMDVLMRVHSADDNCSWICHAQSAPR